MTLDYWQSYKNDIVDRVWDGGFQLKTDHCLINYLKPHCKTSPPCNPSFQSNIGQLSIVPLFCVFLFFSLTSLVTITYLFLCILDHTNKTELNFCFCFSSLIPFKMKKYKIFKVNMECRRIALCHLYYSPGFGYCIALVWQHIFGYHWCSFTVASGACRLFFLSPCDLQEKLPVL